MSQTLNNEILTIDLSANELVKHRRFVGKQFVYEHPLKILSNEEMLKSEPVLSCPVYWLKNTQIAD